MSRHDFETSTLEEFRAICEAWSEAREAEERDAWERMRLQTTIGIQPHVKGRILPEKLLPLPWDRKKKNQDSDGLTAAEKKQRFEEIKKRIG